MCYLWMCVTCGCVLPVCVCYLCVSRRVWIVRLRPQQGVRVHLGPQAGNVARAEVLTQVTDLLQLQQVDTQHLQSPHHLHTHTHTYTLQQRYATE